MSNDRDRTGWEEESPSGKLIESMDNSLPENIARTLIEALVAIRPEDLGRVPVLGEAVLSFSTADLNLLRIYINDALEQIYKDLFAGKTLVAPVCPQPPIFPDRRLDDDAYAEATEEWRSANGRHSLKEKQYHVEMQRYQLLKADRDQLWENLHVLYSLESELRDCRLEAKDLEATMLSKAIHASVAKVGDPSEGEGE